MIWNWWSQVAMRWASDSMNICPQTAEILKKKGCWFVNRWRMTHCAAAVSLPCCPWWWRKGPWGCRAGAAHCSRSLASPSLWIYTSPVHAKQQGNTRTHGMPLMRKPRWCSVPSKWLEIPPELKRRLRTVVFCFYFKVVAWTAQILASPAHLRQSSGCCFISLCRTNRETKVTSCADGSRQACGGPHAPVPEVWRGRPRAEAAASGSDKVLLPLVFTWLIFLFSLASWYLGSSVVMVNLSLFFS